jgi:hypothetical protein
MTANIKDIIDNTKNLYITDSALESLMDFERVLDELDTYVFKNWLKGELVEGPIYEKYFVVCTFMWPYKLMPDPRGAERLLDYGCYVRYKQTKFHYPVTVKDQDDFRPGTRMPKMAEKPIWLVEIVMPKQLMRDIHRGSIELESETLDLEDIEQSYEVGLDDDIYKQNDDENPNAQQQPVAPAQPIA